jgi:hypothetical protein
MSALRLGADLAAQVEGRGVPRVWDSRLEFPSSASHGEPARTAAHLAHGGTEVEVADAVAGADTLAGSEMPVAFGQHLRLKTVSGISAIACPYRGSKVVGVRFLAMQSGPMGRR